MGQVCVTKGVEVKINQPHSDVEFDNIEDMKDPRANSTFQPKLNRNMMLTSNGKPFSSTLKGPIFNMQADVILEDLEGRVGSVQERYGKLLGSHLLEMESL